MKQQRRVWAREELVLAFNLYCRTPFGHIHRLNPRIIELANKIERTPSALAMKMVNFASLDPAQQKRGIKGLQHASCEDKKVWEEYHDNWERLAMESQIAIGTLNNELLFEDESDEGHFLLTETERKVKTRLLQNFFRNAVLASYNCTCAICGMSLRIMLNASHIIPWSKDRRRRVDPRNGICLCALHDRAFDRGVIAISDKFRIIVSDMTKIKTASRLHQVGLIEVAGAMILLPDRFYPDKEALAYHRENVFMDSRGK